nr:3'-5' exonuclease [Pseudomonas sp. GGS8]
MRNPAQLKKDIHTHTLEDSPAVSLFRTELDDDEALPHVLTKIAARAKPGSVVYILARFNFLLPDTAKLNQLNNSYPHLTIKTYSIHTSKGQEADYIVTLGNKAGKFGMPPQKASHPLLEALLPPRESFAHAKERRLFYVALTRAKRRVYLVVGKGKVSSFVKELLDDQYDVEVNEFGEPAAVSARALACPVCQEGELTLRTKKKGRESFFFCSLSPD